MVLKPQRDVLGGPDDFEVVSGRSDDDGQKYTGGRVLKVMQAEGVIDAVIVVSRWFGGEMLGRVRFDHIELCAREVCHTFRRKDDMATCIATLASLDQTLVTQLAGATRTADNDAKETGEGNSTVDGSAVIVKKPTDPSYSALEQSLDVAKAKRLITARENSIRSVRVALKKAQGKTA